MPDSTSLPIPIPELTRVHCLNGLDTIIADLNNFLDEHITLVILGTFENSKMLLENANQLCLQPGAHPKQSILWINDIDHLAALRPKFEKAIQDSFPDKEVDLNNIRAASVLPKSKQIAYVIYIDPTKSPDPRDKRKKLSTFQMARAFNAAIKALPNPENENESKSETSS
ncbi:MAG: hypothetical protein AAF847_20375 [Bacteroidota bacterium]